MKSAAAIFFLFLSPFLVRGQRVLDTATITARRIIVTPRLDGFVFDARQTHPAAGEMVTDLLRRLPGVQIDEQGAPIIRGSGQVKVFIDGRPSEAYASTVAEALKLLPADNIAKIEVITHPSARYDAEGVDAVINIFTKKQQADGASGSLNSQFANRSSQFQAETAWRKHRWVVNADASRYTYHYNSNSVLNRTDPASHLLQTKAYDERSHNLSAGATLSWLADSLVTMNLRYQYGQAHGKTFVDCDNQVGDIAAWSIGDIAAWSTHTDNPTHRHLHSLNWGIFGSTRNRSLEYDAMANWFSLQRASDYTQTGYGPTQTSQNHLDNRELALQGDITKKFPGHMTLDAGVKGSFRKFTNQNLLTPDTAHSNRFYFHRAILALYGSYTLLLGDWKMRFGARYEQTHWPLHFRDTALTPPDYKNFLPDATISFNLAKGQSLSIGYSRKLVRPYIDDLNPVVNYIDSLNIEYGNPSLRPALQNNYELNYNYHQPVWLLNTSLFLRQTKHSIQNIRLLQPGGIIASTYENIADNYTAGLTANLFLQPKRFTVNLTNTLAYLVFNSPMYPQKRGVEFSTGVDLSYKAISTLTFSGMGYFYTPQVNLQGSRTGWRNYSLMAGKDIPHTGLSLSFRIESLFAHYQYTMEKTADKNYTQTSRAQFVNRFFRFGATWKIGKKEIKTPTSRTINADN
jgi:ferric enterobactin receptor